MSNVLSDHYDSNSFAYDKSWEDIESMLDKAERVRNKHLLSYEAYKEAKNKKKMLYHARNAKALEGAIKTLRWCLGDRTIDHPLN